MKTTLAIARGGAGSAPYVENFEIEFVAGQSVLDGHFAALSAASWIKRSPSAILASTLMRARNA